MNKYINIHEAKTNFSKLVARVINGEEIVISKAGNPVAKLVPYRKTEKERVPGSAIGSIKVSDDFYSPLPDEVVDSFEGN